MQNPRSKLEQNPGREDKVQVGKHDTSCFCTPAEGRAFVVWALFKSTRVPYVCTGTLNERHINFFEKDTVRENTRTPFSKMTVEGDCSDRSVMSLCIPP